MYIVSKQDNAKHVGEIEMHGRNFTVLQLEDCLIFGSPTNAILLEQGHILREEGESDQKLVEELHAELEVYFTDGPRFVSRIICRETL